MISSKKMVVRILATLLALTFGVSAFANSKPNGPKPRKEVMKKFGLTEDPGIDPDPTKIWTRDGVRFTIEKIPAVNIKPGDKGEGWVKFRYMQAQDLEVYQKNDEFVWVWLWYHEPRKTDIRYNVDDLGRKVKIENFSPNAIEHYKKLRKEFVTVTPPLAGRTVVFEQSSKGLPTSGSWRNAADTGDMNGDGFVDLVLPPQRGMDNLPSIYLGDGKGGWTFWEESSFSDYSSYGSVSVGDLNGDGHLDIAQAAHLRGPRVYLADGKGHFESSSNGLPTDYPTRRLRLGDVDADGDLDLVVLSEGPVQRGVGSGPDDTELVKVKAYLNDGSGSNWALVDVNAPNLTLGGDWMQLADMNGDGLPDIVGSSVYFGGRSLLQISSGPATWEARGPVFPISSYYVAMATGRFSGGARDEAIMSFQRVWSYQVDPELVENPEAGKVAGLERVVWNEDGTLERTPVVQWLGTSQQLEAVGAGDFDGDGNLDIVFVDSVVHELVALLGDGKGSFTMADVAGVTLPDNRVYDIHVADVNADDRPDLVLLFEASEVKKNGSVRVWLGRGAKSDGGA